MSADHPWVRVGKVPFGRGVFARRDIPKGTELGVVKGKVLDDPNYASAYCIDLGMPYSLEPRAPFRYLNHCCEPNCHLQIMDSVYEDGTPAPSEVTVETLAAIPEGAELTIDYQWSADGAIKCLCGHKECRGWVVSKEDLAKLLKKHAQPKQSSAQSKRAKTPTQENGDVSRSPRKTK